MAGEGRKGRRREETLCSERRTDSNATGQKGKASQRDRQENGGIEGEVEGIRDQNVINADEGARGSGSRTIGSQGIEDQGE